MNIIKAENAHSIGHGKEYFLFEQSQNTNIYVKKNVTNDRCTYSFFDEGTVEDFINITNAINEVILPDKIEYSGVTDIVGFFEKNNIRVNMLHIGMYGNNILTINPNDYNVNQINIIDEWAVMINNKMIKNLLSKIEEQKKTK